MLGWGGGEWGLSTRHSRAGGNPEPLTVRLQRRPARLDSRLRGNDGVGVGGNARVGLRVK
ncbi:hypothetical protein DC429_16210 [Arthrobacter sp. TPD3018]|nr:hypothetical protein DC429_16210 [Arthrobacter sp. TPD3018]PVE80684.1 hypothetical protein DC431_15600 [Sphingomonas melonis]